jgi:hypothetical protein
MMKVRWLIGGVVLAMAFAVPAQAQFFADNFDSYAAGSMIAGQGGWETWGGDPGADAMVTSTQSNSPPNSLAVSGTADVVHRFAGASGGTWYAKAQTFVPSSQSGELFFIMLNIYDGFCTNAGDCNWSVQVAMCQSGCNTTGVNPGFVTNLGGTDVPGGGALPLLTDQWVEVVVEIDFAANLYTVTYGGAFLDIQQWTTTGSLEVAAFDLYSDGSSESYMDDVWLDTNIPVELMQFDVE